ncbi:unnamed protein product [Effrenium voratum]|nr:unnamed protein product [Effrenium voratum]
MALAWAQRQQQDPAVSALLGLEAASSTQDSQPSSQCEGLAGYCLVFTLVLPDGLGDLIFGQNAVEELLDVGPVAWVRCHVSDEQLQPGEQLIASTARKLRFNLASSGKSSLHSAISRERLEQLWVEAKERFLAPWIFGLSENDQVLLDLAKNTGKPFWALTEYGRSMGNIHSYSKGLGHLIPTGWSTDGTGGVFRSILRAARTETPWRRLLMDYCGLKGGKVRLWWFYSRKDDEKKHSFRELDREALGDEEVPSHVRVVSKVIPIDADGKLARGDEKTSGEKLAEQIFQAAADPSFKPQVDVTSAEVTGGVGQLSQFLWDSNLLGRVEGSQVDIIVAPNVFTAWRKASAENRAVARVKQIDLVSRDGTSQVFNFPPGRKIYICSVRVPREEMRSFLEVCEEPVYTTGDQSLAEAMWMGKVPCVKPDAKVQQWHLALMAKVSGVMDKVPDLGQELRKLVAEESAREAAKRRSKERSEACERQLVAQLGSPPSQWNSTQQVLARSGMLG